jgi:hypothetical protein
VLALLTQWTFDALEHWLRRARRSAEAVRPLPPAGGG